MTDDIVYKTVPLPLASFPGRVLDTAEEREARIQAHMGRVHPMLDAIRREEARVYLETGDPVERSRCNDRKSRQKQRALAREREAKIAARRGDMKIKGNLIHNWQAPGKEWWAAREANPREPESIDATFRVQVSWEQYQAICDLILKFEDDGKSDETIVLDADREVG